MNIEDLREYCIKKPFVSEGLPFGPDVLVLKVMEKVFLLCPLNAENMQMNLKCEPEWAIELREIYPSVQPGYHMNKKHWNTVDFEGALEERLLRQLIDHSYEQVVKSLKRAEREALAGYS